MLKIMGHRLLIKPDPPKDQVKLGAELKAMGFEVGMTADQERRELVGTEIGTLVAIGNTCWRAYDGKDAAWEPWSKVGDRVTFAKYSGKIVTDPETDEKFMVVNDVDMQCVVTGEHNPFED